MVVRFEARAIGESSAVEETPRTLPNIAESTAFRLFMGVTTRLTRTGQRCVGSYNPT